MPVNSQRIKELLAPGLKAMEGSYGVPNLAQMRDLIRPGLYQLAGRVTEITGCRADCDMWVDNANDTLVVRIYLDNGIVNQMTLQPNDLRDDLGAVFTRVRSWAVGWAESLVGRQNPYGSGLGNIFRNTTTGTGTVMVSGGGSGSGGYVGTWNDYGPQKVSYDNSTVAPPLPQVQAKPGERALDLDAARDLETPETPIRALDLD